ADLIPFLVAAREIHAVAVVGQREDTAGDRHSRRARVPRLLPRRSIKPDLLGLLDMEWLAALVDLECRALQVHAELRRPLRRRIGAGAPPDALAQTLGMRLETQKARRGPQHRGRAGLGEALSPQQVGEGLSGKAR